MKQKRQEILKSTVDELLELFKFSKVFDVSMDHMGVTLKGTGDPIKLEDQLNTLVKLHGFSYVKGDVAEVLQKDSELDSTVVITRRFDRSNILSLGVTV